MPGSTFFLRRCLTRFSSQITSLSSPLLFFLFIEFDSGGKKSPPAVFKTGQCTGNLFYTSFTSIMSYVSSTYSRSNCANVSHNYGGIRVINAKQKPLQPLPYESISVNILKTLPCFSLTFVPHFCSSRTFSSRLVIVKSLRALL